MNMNVMEATRSYERWLASHTRIVKPDLNRKHQLMAASPFPFLRATYYRWTQVFPEVCDQSSKSPKVLAVGDLHIENFGTWRDLEGRLAWGVNDFDEASVLPYTNDLIRVAASASFAAREEHVYLPAKRACEALLAGYMESMKRGGLPFVLAEKHGWLKRIAFQQLKTPELFWQKLGSWPTISEKKVPKAALKGLDNLLHDSKSPTRIVLRQAGLGSRGHQRYVALQNHCGGLIAREAKALVPPAASWAQNKAASIRYAEILKRAVRVPDPLFRVEGNWLVRRLAPDCTKIEMVDLPDQRNEERLLYCMGWETANIHLGTKGARAAILKDLRKRKPGWLLKSARAMEDAMLNDWKRWRKNS
jgi:hypothetical protein